MPACHADPATKYEDQNKHTSNIVKGGFSAPTRIGFNAVTFDYTSKVTFIHPKLPVNLNSDKKKKSLLWKVTTVCDSSRIFNSLSSEWVIRVDPESPSDRCIVDYQIEMEFASALYSAVTSQFFDLLVANVDE